MVWLWQTRVKLQSILTSGPYFTNGFKSWFWNNNYYKSCIPQIKSQSHMTSLIQHMGLVQGLCVFRCSDGDCLSTAYETAPLGSPLNPNSPVSIPMETTLAEC